MPQELQLTIEETVFRNEENGYSVLTGRNGREEVTVVGILPPLAPGEQAVFEGGYISHPQYGKQWKATSCRIQKPDTMLGMERFLGSGLIRGVGPATARLIVNHFGTRALDIIGDEPGRLTEVTGIGQKKAAMIAASYQEQYAVREAMVYLQSYGITPRMAMKISKYYGNRTQTVLRENPYKLVDDIEGIGFKTADTIALSMGIPTDSDFRLRCGIKYVLTDASADQGHTCLPKDALIERACQLLKADTGLIEHHMFQLLLEKELTGSAVDGEDMIFLSRIYFTEAEIARRLVSLRGEQKCDQRAALELKITSFENANRITFSDNQRRAVLEALENGLMIITGGPGTGKTTIINCILTLLSGEAMLAAPTGRAAKRMSEATGHEAKTLHRLLEFGGDDGMFARNEESPLDTSCVIVDEMSMVDIYLMRFLLRALKPGTRLILVGDADQLPSVGPGNVLGDMLQSGVIPSVRLTDIFRQQEESLIVTNAHAINEGKMPEYNQKGKDFFLERRPYSSDAAKTIVDLCRQRLPAFMNTGAPVRDIQVLSPTKKGDCGVGALNILLQEAFNPPAKGKKEVSWGNNIYRVGDKVMHIKNNYQIGWTTLTGNEGLGAFNGDIGYIRGINTEDQTVTVLYDDERIVEYEYSRLEELELAYCMSVHKSQGSEFPCVVMPVVGGPKMLLTRNLFYTALTRARKLVVLVGREDCIAEMVNNNYIQKRYTALRERLADFANMES
ncbi:MAG: ATP-dependent RecD-like DNA helicase [Clostridiales bacterium]|nr:ATP-dependent RecD-like DNA helicase [Clostridiales bacterium]